MKNKISAVAVIALTLPFCACAPTTSPDPAVKAAEGQPGAGAPLKPLTSLNDPSVRQSIAILANRQPAFGYAIIRATTRDIKSASIGGPVRIPSGLFGYTGADRYCVQADFEPESQLFAGNHGTVFFVEPRGASGFFVKTSSNATGLVVPFIKDEPCGSVPMEPFPELVAQRKKYLADG